MRELCDITVYWNDEDKDLFYLTLRKHNYSDIRRIERGQDDHFVDRYRGALIRSITVIYPVLDDLLGQKLLTQEQYNGFINKRTSENKMRYLYKYIVRIWNYTEKDTLYMTLRKHNYTIVRELERGMKLVNQHNRFFYYRNFLWKHQPALIRRIMMVDPVLDDLLDQKLLTQEQYNDLCNKPTSEDKMRDLCDTVRFWGYHANEKVYTALSRYNPWVIKGLELEDWYDSRTLSHSSSARDHHFVDRHRSDIIRRIILIDPVLDDLREKRLLTKEQYDDLCKYTTYEDKTRALCDIVKNWGYTDKDTFYVTLKIYNDSVIMDMELEGKTVRSRNPYYSDHFVDRYRGALIRSITVIDPVLDDLLEQKLLTQEQYYDLINKRTSEDKMRDLYGMIRFWNHTDKDVLYLSLRTHNYTIIRDLEGDQRRLPYSSDHFVDRHWAALTQRITVIYPVLDDLLDQELLTQEQYYDLINKRTSEDKMRDLYGMIRFWNHTDKDVLYLSLRTHNYNIVRDLEGDQRRLPYSSDHFVDRHWAALTQRITVIYPVLDDLLDQELLTQEQYYDLINKRTSEDKMRDLYGMIRFWNHTDKDVLYLSLRTHNYTIVRDLEGDQRRLPYSNDFLWKQDSALIRRIMMVDPVLDDLLDQELLTQEQYNDLCNKPTSEDKMRDLCHTVRSWGDHGKKEVAIALRKHNRYVMEDMDLEYQLMPVFQGMLCSRPIFHSAASLGKLKDDTLQTATTQSWETQNITDDSSATTEPSVLGKLMDNFFSFMTGNWETRNIPEAQSLSYYEPRESPITAQTQSSDKPWGSSFTGPILTLKGSVVSSKDFTFPSGTTGSWKTQNIPEVESDEESLCSHITVLPDLESLSSPITVPQLQIEAEEDDEFTWPSRSPQLRTYPQSLVTKTAGEQLTAEPSSSDIKDPLMEKSEKMISSTASCVRAERQQMECKLCGKAQYSNDVVIPILNGSTYRLKLKCEGLFRCQKTGIQFLVKHPVTIQYNLESWHDHLTGIQGDRFEVVGPLFNIKTDDPYAVSAVYLPHYLCIAGFTGDKSQIKCAHFKDGNMTLEPPTQIKPFYIILENPSFSCLGPLLSLVKKKVPIHGGVLIYFRVVCQDEPEYQEYKIHLYLLPYPTHTEEALDKKNVTFGLQRINKPPHTCDTVYTRIKYLVRVQPGASIIPKKLKFQSEPYQYTEINLKANDTNIYLNVSEEESEPAIWEAQLTKGDIRDWTRQMAQPPHQRGKSLYKGSFVDKHREVLIREVHLVEPVLDGLKSAQLLTDEQYDVVRSRTTSQQKMRALYDSIRSWGDGDKSKLYNILKDNNGPLIRKLKQAAVPLKPS
ncbi:uncharacterized protein LOC134945751 isoform X2 [Pseudophryne corroboree]